MEFNVTSYRFVGVIKRLATGILALSFLLVSSEFHELLRFQSLYSHYQEHKQANQDLDFWSFIGQHYFDTKAQTDESKHENLPFSGSGHFIFTPIVERFEIICWDFTPAEKNTTKLSPQDVSMVASKVFPDIWQPPKA